MCHVWPANKTLSYKGLIHKTKGHQSNLPTPFFSSRLIEAGGVQHREAYSDESEPVSEDLVHALHNSSPQVMMIVGALMALLCKGGGGLSRRAGPRLVCVAYDIAGDTFRLSKMSYNMR